MKPETRRAFILIACLIAALAVIQIADHIHAKSDRKPIDATSAATHPASVYPMPEAGSPSRNAVAERPFILTVYTDFDQTTVPIHIVRMPDAEVSWKADCDGDGTFEIQSSDEIIKCYYETQGLHQISIKGKLPGILLRSRRAHTDMEINPWVFRSVEQWGTVEWRTMEAMFEGQREIVLNATDTPDLRNVRSLARMFSRTRINSPQISRWDVSGIEDMTSLFEDNTKFNQPLSEWNTGKVKTMNAMFKGAIAFDQPLDRWNVSQVVDMAEMFYNAKQFSQPLNGWDTSHVQTMANMFAYSGFNAPIDRWNVSGVTDMSYMFAGNRVFNQNIDTWNVIRLKTTFAMFFDAVLYNQPLNHWDVSSVGNMAHMFHGAVAFDQPLDHWDVSKVKTMRNMFYHASSFSRSLIDWKPASLQDTTCMLSFSANTEMDIIGKWVGTYSLDLRLIRSDDAHDECFDEEIGE